MNFSDVRVCSWFGFQISHHAKLLILFSSICSSSLLCSRWISSKKPKGPRHSARFPVCFPRNLQSSVWLHRETVHKGQHDTFLLGLGTSDLTQDAMRLLMLYDSVLAAGFVEPQHHLTLVGASTSVDGTHGVVAAICTSHANQVALVEDRYATALQSLQMIRETCPERTTRVVLCAADRCASFVRRLSPKLERRIGVSTFCLERGLQAVSFCWFWWSKYSNRACNFKLARQPTWLIVNFQPRQSSRLPGFNHC